MTAIGAEELDLLVAKLLIVTVEFAFALRTGYPEDFCHGASRQKKSEIRSEIRNRLRNSTRLKSKFEARDPKQQKGLNQSKLRKSKTANRFGLKLSSFWHF